jgi:hypothetical protein
VTGTGSLSADADAGKGALGMVATGSVPVGFQNTAIGYGALVETSNPFETAQEDLCEALMSEDPDQIKMKAWALLAAIADIEGDGAK